MTKRLEIDDAIVFVNRETIRDALGVSDPTLRHYQFLLNEVSPKGWEYRQNDRGFSRSSIEVLFSFRQMVLDAGKRQAVLNIKGVMESRNG
jgi:hypothetical protein